VDELTKLRNGIDHIDDAIMDLLEQRFTLSEEIGQLKKKTMLEVTHPNREKNILAKAENLNHNDAIRSIYKTIFTHSKSIQK
jgi:chorismate mutase